MEMTFIENMLSTSVSFVDAMTYSALLLMALFVIYMRVRRDKE